MEEKRKHAASEKPRRRKKEIPPLNSKEYVDYSIRKRKKVTKIAISVVAVIVVLVVLCTAFGLKTMSSTKIIKGISIDGMDVSGMTKEEVTKMLNEKIEQRNNTTVTLKNGEYTKELSYAEIDLDAKVDQAVEEAVKKGRNGNIIQNNFRVLQSNFKKENIDLPVNYNKETIEEVVNSINAEIPGKVEDYAYSIEDDELYISKGKDGIVVEKESLEKDIDSQLTDVSTDVKKELNIPTKQEKAKDIDLDVIYSEIHTEPKDAYIVEEPFQVVADVPGVDFAITMEEAKQIILQEDKEEYIIPLKITKAKTTIADLGSKAFPYRLGVFTTRYDAGNISRTTNLSLAAKKINNYVIQPGEVFSYNKVVGKRSVEAGYKEAAIYTANGVENGIGGGICQISSTLYNAVLFANLEIVERHNHSYVTSYCEAGRDATVSYGSLDFKFKNTRKYPVKITATVSGGVATVAIYGIKENPDYTVTVSSSVTSSIPAPEKRIEDPSIPAGQEVVVKKGTNGCRSVTYKTVYDTNGTKISSQQISADYYGTIAREIKVGTGAQPAPSPSPSVEPSPTPVTPTPSVEPSPEPSPEPPSPEPDSEG